MDHSDIVLAIANVHLIQNDHRKAIELLEGILGKNPNHLAALQRLGEILYAQGDLDGATSQYQKLIKLDPMQGSIWNDFAMCYFLKKKYLMVIFIHFIFRPCPS